MADLNSGPVQDLQLVSTFERYFTLDLAQHEDKKTQVYRIRKEVFIDEMRCHLHQENRQEQDEFDTQSLHCLLTHNQSGLSAGCVRLVMPDQLNTGGQFPFQSHRQHTLVPDFFESKVFDPEDCCEVSRLAVLPRFRQRKGEREHVSGIAPFIDRSLELSLRSFPLIAVSLYYAAISLFLSSRQGHLYIVVEPRLKRHLARFGLEFEPVSEVFEYYGRRAVYAADRAAIQANIDALNSEMAALYESVNQALSRSVKNEMDLTGMSLKALN
jgi:N-acyl amino acid synthase of PEP-CTERM/exosortase system